jgi:3-hydroxy-9,10-secoandrosta-1,3,5(10)-triene-9,17-dione monooxygenase
MSIAQEATNAATASEPDLTSEEVIRRAREISKTLVPRQQETEERTYYAEDTHEAFRAAGFYRLLVPKKYGGYEFGIDTFLKVAAATARGCPSTGWCLTLGTSHALTVGSFLEERAQAQLFAQGDFICPTTVRPQGSAQLNPDGSGWLIDGEFNFCSGAPYGMYYMGHTIPPATRDGQPPKGPMLFIAPRSEWTRLDDWGLQLGLKGSGSHSIRFDSGQVPFHYVLENTGLMSLDVSGGTPGLDLHGNPMYAGSSYSFFMLEAAAVSVGIAQGALDASGELMPTKQAPLPPFGPRYTDPDYQRWYGTGAGKIATAEAAMINCAEQWMGLAERNAFTPEEDMRLVTISKEVVSLCYEAVASMSRSAGSTSIRNGERIERIYRDMSTVNCHNGIVAFGEMATRQLAQATFGVV